ncbi:MAG: hypothetical protein JWQ04_408 [Pedosphaera sp.]|nr:hypothetical protein [Pedosphaera sp.]
MTGNRLHELGKFAMSATKVCENNFSHAAKDKK